MPIFMVIGELTQLAECQLDKLEVEGSSPSLPTIALLVLILAQILLN